MSTKTSSDEAEHPLDICYCGVFRSQHQTVPTCLGPLLELLRDCETFRLYLRHDPDEPCEPLVEDGA